MENFNNSNKQSLADPMSGQAYGGLYGAIYHELMDMQKRISILEIEQERGSSVSCITTLTDDNAKEEIENLRKENKQLNESNARLESILKKNKENRRNDNFREELTKAKAENERLSKDINKLTQDFKTLEIKNETLATENERLYSIAYIDSKTKVMNTNAFNRDFKKRNLSATSLAIFNICNTKSINENLGRKAGDGLIRTVAAVLAETFGKENVYRVMGDQFYVLSNDETSLIMSANTVLSKCSEQKIKIIAGYGNGNEAESHNEVIAQAEENILMIKKTGQPVKTVTADTHEYAFEDDRHKTDKGDEPSNIERADEPKKQPEEVEKKPEKPANEGLEEITDEDLAEYMDRF